MSISLRTYLVQLATSPDRLTEFMADPRGASTAAGLSEADQAVLFSGNQQAIYQNVSEGGDFGNS